MSFPNPLIPGFNPDPSIVRVGDDYYLVTATFEYLPGIPVYHSTDLATWRQIGNVITREEQVIADVPSNLGVWAPTIRYRDGLFHVIVTDVGGRGTCLYTATDPAGPWSDGLVVEIEGIDPDLAWDDEGAAYLTYSAVVINGTQDGMHRGIEQVRIDTGTGSVLSPPVSLLTASAVTCPGAPHLYRHGSWWYLMIAEGGTERGHAISIARSASPEGPFEPDPRNPVVTARGTAAPVQCTGHGDLVEGPEGPCVVMLGTRPRGLMGSFSALGRETFISPARWTEDGWLEIDPVGLDPRPGSFWSEEFDDGLGPQWVGVRRFPAEIADLEARPGWLTLRGEGSGLGAPAPVFIGHRQEHQTAEMRAVIDASSGRGGLAVRYDEQFHYEVEVGSGRIITRAVIAGFVREVASLTTDTVVELVISSRVPPRLGMGHPSCDLVSLGFVGDDGGIAELMEIDGRYLSNEVAASFTGRVFGVYAIGGTVSVARIDYRGEL